RRLSRVLHSFPTRRSSDLARPQDLRKIYLTAARMAALRDPLAWCVKHRLGYRVVEEADLAKLTSSAHHEGVCFEMLRKPQPSLADRKSTRLNSSHVKISYA